MTDSEFVVRISHIILGGKFNPMEQLHFIRLSYAKMAFPEEKLPDVYIEYMKRLYPIKENKK